MPGELSEELTRYDDSGLLIYFCFECILMRFGLYQPSLNARQKSPLSVRRPTFVFVQRNWSAHALPFGVGFDEALVQLLTVSGLQAEQKKEEVDSLSNRCFARSFELCRICVIQSKNVKLGQ